MENFVLLPRRWTDHIRNIIQFSRDCALLSIEQLPLGCSTLESTWVINPHHIAHTKRFLFNTSIIPDQTDSMVMMRTVVRKIQELAYNQSTNYSEEWAHPQIAWAPRCMRPKSFFPVWRKTIQGWYAASTSRLAWMGQRPGPSVSHPCATQYRSTSEKPRLASCGLSYCTWSPGHAWCTSDRPEPPWSHDYQYLLSVHWLAASSKWTIYYRALIHYYVRQLTVFCTTLTPPVLVHAVVVQVNSVEVQTGVRQTVLLAPKDMRSWYMLTQVQ